MKYGKSTTPEPERIAPQIVDAAFKVQKEPCFFAFVSSCLRV